MSAVRPRTRPSLLLGGFMGLLVLAVTLVPAGRPALAKDTRLGRRGTPEAESSKEIRRKAIRRGCKWLAKNQRIDGGIGENSAVIALTSLSVLAFMSDGSTDGRGPYGKNVQKGLNFLLGLIERKPPQSRWPKGYFEYPHDTTSRMHGQGYATLALATALGTAKAERYTRIKKVLLEAVKCCEAAQTRTGGYGYKPTDSAEHEGSVTVAVAQGLRAARDAGLVIDDRVINNGLQYLRRSQKEDGSFKYSIRQDTSTYALTGAALSAFFLFGEYEDATEQQLEKKAINYIRESLEDRGIRQPWYYYGHFYSAWACWQKDGHTWDRSGLWGWWQSKVYPDLLERQTSDGSFEEEEGRYNFGPEMSTAFAVLTLAIPDEVLPIFQR